MSKVAAFLRRLVPVVVLVAIVGVAGWLLFGRSEPKPTYTVELDNAFGLTEGSEFRTAGVTVGAVKTMKVDKRTARALVKVELQRTDFGDLRKDVTCSVEPQSVIGEYFMDCQPGTAKEKLRVGSRIPVSQTTGTIPPDLVASVMRRPQREQLGLILTELGSGFATRGPELQQIIKRAIPALRETDKVLKILADNRRTLVALNKDASVVLTRLASNRRDVGRFVREARDTATISANRRVELAETIRRLPAFLRELRPTLRDLGTVADKQTPALRDLRIAAPQLTTLLNRLGPFAEASGPALEALGEAGKLGTAAARPATTTLQVARRLGQELIDPATNLRFVLEHVDDRKNAVEPSPVSPEGKGFTGLEALLRYPYVQSQAINLFDSRGYTLKLNALVNECSEYTNAESARRDPERTSRCNSWLGPNQPGVTTPDPSESGDGDGQEENGDDNESSPIPELPGLPGLPTLPGLPPLPIASSDARKAPAPAAASPAAPAPTPAATEVEDLVDDVVQVLPGAQKSDEDADRESSDQAAGELLDYLLGS